MTNSIRACREAVAKRERKLRDVVSGFLKSIEDQKELNAFLEVFDEEALERAEIIETKIHSGKAGKLAGAVVAIKDNISYKGHRLSASSKILEGFEAIFDSTVVERLIEEDAIIIGRTNCDEFAMGSSNENSAFGSVKNPLDPSRVSGGSSGGSAVAVAGRMCHVSLGTDTGGSIRQPSAFCGVYGLKPTYGRVSRHGVIAFASSFDQVGPMANNLEDLAICLEVISGPDAYDATASQREVRTYEPQKAPKLERVAVIKGLEHTGGLEKELEGIYKVQLEGLRSAGVEVIEVDFEFMDYVVPCYYMLTTAEASSNLARYTGVLYGKREDAARNLDETFIQSRTRGFGEEVKRRIMLGTFVLSEGYYDAYYAKAQKVRSRLRQELRRIFEKAEGLLLPTCPTSAFALGSKLDDPIQMYLSDIFTVLANLAGAPAISLPHGKDAKGLPYAMQLVCPEFMEAEMIGYAAQLDKINQAL